MTTQIREAGWLARERNALAHDPEYVAEGMALRFIEQIIQAMDTEQMSPAALAEQLGVSRAYISKMLNAPSNMTLRSVATFALALKHRPHLVLSVEGGPSAGRRVAAIQSTIDDPAPPAPAASSTDSTFDAMRRGFLYQQQRSDAAVKEAGELRAMADEISAQITRDGEASGGIPWAWYMRWRTRYDSLTTTGGSSEPQKGINQDG